MNLIAGVVACLFVTTHVELHVNSIISVLQRKPGCSHPGLTWHVDSICVHKCLIDTVSLCLSFLCLRLLCIAHEVQYALRTCLAGSDSISKNLNRTKILFRLNPKKYIYI